MRCMWDKYPLIYDVLSDFNCDYSVNDSLLVLTEYANAWKDIDVKKEKKMFILHMFVWQSIWLQIQFAMLCLSFVCLYRRGVSFSK